MSNDAPVIIFTHIPKCAGTTVRNVFNCVYGAERIYDPFDQPDFENSEKGAFDRYDVLFGHRHYGAHEKLTRPYRYVTFLRNPVKRLYSNWQYIRTHSSHRDYEKAIKYDNVLDFYANGGEPWGANGMTKMLAGYDPRTIDNVDHIIGRQASRNLNTYYFAGTSDLMELSLVCLRQKMDWKTIPFCPSRQNASQYTAKLDLETKIQLSDYCNEDLELTLEVLSKLANCGEALVEEAKDLTALHKIAVNVFGPLCNTMQYSKSLNDRAKKAVEIYGTQAHVTTIDDDTFDRAKAYVSKFEAGL